MEGLEPMPRRDRLQRTEERNHFVLEGNPCPITAGNTTGPSLSHALLRLAIRTASWQGACRHSARDLEEHRLAHGVTPFLRN